MLLSAQRVRSPHGVLGINRYAYRHGGHPWSVADLEALEHAASLVSQDLEVPPGGNEVRSFLDIFAPDGTSPVELARLAAAVRGGADPNLFPATFVFGTVVFRLGLVFGLVPSWRSEVTELATRLVLSAEDAA